MRGARTGTPGKDQFVGRRLLRLGCFCGARSHDTNAWPVSQLAPVGSNHHSQIQSLVSCHWTRGQSERLGFRDRKSTRLNSSHLVISYAVFCLKKKKKKMLYKYR